MSDELTGKVERAIKLIQSASKIAAQHGQPLEVCYSGGKDSDVILELTKMADVQYRAIYKNTTIDPPGTIKHAIDMGAEIMRPQKTFAQLIREKGIPSRYVRFCCSYLKEYKVLDYAVLGIRREESTKRSQRYKEPEICRVYNKNEKARQYLPILDWTIVDVAEFIAERNIRCAPIYYDEQNNFHPERRLGCMCCPLASRGKRLKEFIKYPNIVKLYVNNCQVWLDNHKSNKPSQKFTSAFDSFVSTTFFDSYEDFMNATNGLFGKVDCKEFIENYFNIKFKKEESI